MDLGLQYTGVPVDAPVEPGFFYYPKLLFTFFYLSTFLSYHNYM